MTINIKEFTKQFNKEYDFLYENRNNVAGFNEAVNAFDEFLTSQSDFIREFNEYRGDIISSDREAAAFMFALDIAI